MAFRQIAYVSASTELLEPEDVSALVSCARRNNVRDDITGMLLVSRTGFVQVLEGPRVPVMALYRRLEDDPRHHSLVLLHKTDVPLRAFPDCPMALKQADADSIRRLEQTVPQLAAGLCSMLTAEAVGLA